VSYEDVLYEVADGRATITINRPDRLNAFRVQTIRELCEAFEAAADDESVGVIVFTGAGERAFCVGGDVREPTRTAAEKRGLHHLHDRLAVAIRNNGKPIIVQKKAREILYLTRPYSAEEALAMGLVNAVVPDEELDAEVDRWCAEILRRSPQGLRLAKLALNAGTDQLYSAVQHGVELVAINHVYGPEPQEGIASFQEKRPADWRKFRAGQGPEPG
jgi:1,4-dihydroxy-2-naphthoyl-CoA synthase